jgi:hypothetical protein
MLGIKIEFDEKSITHVMESFQGMHDKIAHLKRVDIGAELSAWQVEDMHRQRPFTMRSRAKGIASTKIRPHSLYEMLRSEGAALSTKEQRSAMRAVRKHFKYPVKRRRKMVYREHRHWSERPILRAELLSILMDRVANLVREKLNWKPEPLHGAEALERHLREAEQRVTWNL